MKVVISLISVALVAGIAWLFSRSVGMGDALRIEWIVTVLVVGGVVARWRIAARRRQRQKLQELRDSALW